MRIHQALARGIEDIPLGISMIWMLSRLQHANACLAQVLLPENPATDVSDEVFKRTPADVKAMYLAARRKQEQGQVWTAPAVYCSC